MLEIVEYLDGSGSSPFGAWFDTLDAQAAARIARVLLRMRTGNLADTKGVGGGVSENRVHFGAGYRIYIHQDGDKLVVLLAGGTKRRQQRDIDAARARLTDYKMRKEAAPWLG